MSTQKHLEVIRLYRIIRSNGTTAQRALRVAKKWVELYPTTTMIKIIK
jgi:hypothetical protein